MRRWAHWKSGARDDTPVLLIIAMGLAPAGPPSERPLREVATICGLALVDGDEPQDDDGERPAA